MRTLLHKTSRETVLLIRINSSTELLNTSQAIDQLRVSFPKAQFATLATPQTETRALLETDHRLDQVLLFPAQDDSQEKSARAFRRFMGRQQISATVVCFGATTGFDYNRHLLSILFCPGRRYFLDRQGRLFSAMSPRGIRVLFGAALALGTQKLVLPLLRALARRRSERNKRIPQTIRRLLVIRLDHIGDVAMSLPAIHALKEHYSSVSIDVLVGSSAAPILLDSADIAEIIPCDAACFSRGGRQQSLRERIALIQRLRQRHYDLAIDLRGDDTSRLWAVASGAKRRAGPDFGPYEPPNQANLSFLLTHPISGADIAGQHAVQACLTLVQSLGVCPPAIMFRLPIAPERERAVSHKQAKQHSTNAYAVLHIRPGNVAKTWSASSFAIVADHLVEKHGLDIILTGVSEDQDTNEKVLSHVRNRTHVHNAAGVYLLEELPALFKTARIMVTVDTGPMHIAAAVGTPIVSLFLPWAAATFFPYGQQDSVVIPSPDDLQQLENSGRLWSGSLLDAISADKVCDAIDRKLVPAHV